MNEKQNQKIGNNSTAIQVNGDLVINPAYDQVRTIFIDLFELNFPKIQQMAKEEADKRIQDLFDNLEQSFLKYKENIDVNKFNNPGIQYQMHDMMKNVVCRGEKSNVELLCEMFSNMLDRDCPEVLERIASEAIDIVPRINRRHLAALTVIVLALEAQCNVTTLEEVDKILGQSITLISEAEDISFSDITYLSCINCIDKRGIMIMGLNPCLISDIEEYKNKNSEEIIKIAETHELENIIKFYDMMTKCQVMRYELTSIGLLIGWLNISKVSDINIKDIFK